MTIFTGIAIYLIIWWTVLFAVLPLGGKTYISEGIEPPVKGMDPGAPIEPRLKYKFVLTTLIAAVVWVLVWACIQFNWIKLPDIPTG